ncbi:isoflavone reductase family protein CipA [Stemphylium lycopersici]|uniref:Isoflavone reductase family protein CipA n=1 Tax=Stemphylium lycopersici TaxID=183478 RepID=A0A364N7W5_STELY|nr:isoflavone reductase family protein CipA [Stemphylium lycopersici]
MSQTITKVALAGATGSLGSRILAALLDAKFEVTVIARKEGQQLPSGVAAKVVDTGSVAAIAGAMHGQDALVDATSGPDPSLQGRFIEAAIESGIYRIVMNEFSADPQDAKARSPLVFHAKSNAFEQIKKVAAEGKLTYTTISNSAFLDWNLRTGFINIDIFNKKVQYMNDGMRPFPWTMLSSVGTAVANVLKMAEQTQNRSFYISNIIKSQKQMANLAKESLGSEGWEETHQDMDQKLKNATADMMAGKVDMQVIGDMIRWSVSACPATRWEQIGDNELLGVRSMTDDEVRNLIVNIATQA